MKLLDVFLALFIGFILFARVSWQVKYQNHFIKARKTSDNSYTNRQVTRNEVRYVLYFSTTRLRHGRIKKNRGGWGVACPFQLYYLNLIKFNFNKGTPCPPPFLDPRMLAVHTNSTACAYPRVLFPRVYVTSVCCLCLHMYLHKLIINLHIFGFVLLYFESLENT